MVGLVASEGFAREIHRRAADELSLALRDLEDWVAHDSPSGAHAALDELARALAARLGAGEIAAFLLVQHATMGLYLGTVFAANHKGMPVLGPDHGLSFFELQILTSRNVRAKASGWPA